MWKPSQSSVGRFVCLIDGAEFDTRVVLEDVPADTRAPNDGEFRIAVDIHGRDPDVVARVSEPVVEAFDGGCDVLAG